MVETFPRSAGSGDGDMRGSSTGAALLVLLASVLWVTVRSQQRGEPCGGSTGDPPAGEREPAGAGDKARRSGLWLGARTLAQRGPAAGRRGLEGRRRKPPPRGRWLLPRALGSGFL